MTAIQKISIGIAIIAVMGGATALTLTQNRDRGVPVRFDVIVPRDLVQTVTASGNIRAGLVTPISSEVSARVTALLVDEGDYVLEGQVLLRLDPTSFEASVARARAQLNQARSQGRQQEANLERAERDLARFTNLFTQDSLLIRRQQLDDASTDVELAARALESQQFAVDQAVASLEEADERLSKTIFQAPHAGTVTRLNVEVGQTVIVGTMNNAGSLVLEVSELSRVEAVLQVDETDIPYIDVGDSTILELDAFPNQLFSGVVTEIGNSAIRPPSSSAGSGQAAAIDYEVVITMDDPPAGIRPDLSATADIITETRKSALSIPIIALTVRPAQELEGGANAAPNQVGEDDERTRGPLSRPENEDVEGVFIVVDGQVRFVPVVIGITGQDHFEVLEGVDQGDTIVAGPYQQIRELTNGDRVQEQDENDVSSDAGSGFFGRR
jgi:HlyD family secretion protein